MGAGPVSAERWATLEPILDAALAAPPAARDALLRAACAGDDALYQEAAAMLAGCAEPDPALDRPAAARFAGLARGEADDAARRALGDALAGRYALVREAGRGAMGVVYLARDVRHGRDVALKVLGPGVAAGGGAARFLDEIRVTAGLRHPHVLPLFDSGVAAGRLYYVTPFVEGGTLRDRLARERLAREGPVPPREAVRLLREVAGALAHAHARGVVHRDVKPENVLLGDGGAVVADFGIAGALAHAAGAPAGDGPPAARPATRPGLGTPGYMAPEQAAAGAPVDHRADLYALGVVAFELLAGRRPAPAPGRAIAAGDLPPGTPPALARLVAALLAPDPARRPTSAAAVAAALEAVERGPGRAARRRRVLRAAGIAPAGLVVGAALLWAATPPGTRAALRTVATRPAVPLDARRIVVAPLEDRTRDPRLDAFGEMAADWITQALARTPELEVVDARTAATTARVVARIPRLLRPGDRAVALARETGAGTVMSGRYYAERDTVRVYVQLADAGTGEVRRAFGPVSGPATALGALVEQVARAAAAHTAAAVDTSPAGRGVGRSAPPSYDAYREANQAWERFYAADFAGAFAHAGRAAELDTAYLLPRIMRAYLHSDLRQWAAADREVAEVARRQALPGAAPLTPVERAAFELVRANVAGDLEGALGAARELRRLAPTSAETDVHVAQHAVATGRPRLALATLAPLDPRRGVLLVAPFYWNWRTAALHALGDHAAELDAAERQRAQFPARNVTTLNRARAFGALGRADAVRDAAAAADDERWAADAVRRRALVEGSRELRAHGRPADGRALLAEALALPDLPGAAVPAAAAAEQQGLLLAEAERWGPARLALERALRADTARLAARGALGAVAARAGDRAAALRADAALAAVGPAAHARGRATMWRARIALALGDPARAVALVRQALGEGYSVMQGYPSLADAPRTFDYGEPTVHADPWLLPLAADPAFRRLLAPRG